MEKAGLTQYHEWIGKKSYEALPELLKDNEGAFDLIFIDGMHLFDYTLVDFFYSFLLTKKEGYIVIDDARHPGVKDCIRYIDTNYSKFVQKLSEAGETMTIYKKIAEDTREWNFHKKIC